MFRDENLFVPNWCCPLAALQIGAKPWTGVSHLAQQPRRTGHGGMRETGICLSWDGSMEAAWRKAIYFLNPALS